MNKKIIIAFLMFFVVTTGCKKYLDINSDPSSPQTPDLASLMQPVISFTGKMMSVDIITAGQLTQNWGHQTANENFDVHGGNTPAQSIALWRSFFAQQGVNINLIIADGTNQKRWDYVGAAIALRAWGLQMTTDFFGEMPYKQAWEENRVTFTYDSQEEVYKAIDSLCISSLSYLNRIDGNNNAASFARGDRVYSGDINKWIKFVYGLRARNWQRLSNKPTYNADSVIAFVDKSFASAADNFLVSHTATRNDDSNPLGAARDNVSVRKQGRFIVQLLDGFNFYGNTTVLANRDPRIRGMLTASPDTSAITTNMPTLNGGYRFLAPSAGDPNTAALPNNNLQGIPTNPLFRQRVTTPYVDSAVTNPALNNFTASVGKYVFRNNALYPVMAYHELQFIKAEAQFRKGLNTQAITTYRGAISTHCDFVNFFNTSANPGIAAITPAQITAYLASPAVIQPGGNLNLTNIMLQKYIGDYGWNLLECWCDVRRYHYFDLDPLTGIQVYRQFVIPVYSAANGGAKPQYRYRPTGVSENDWNLNELRRIGALNVDYHTYEMWFSKP
jgi:hypothetical protein